MAITYHSGGRIQATSTDFAGTPAISGGWKELGRTTLGSAGDTINVTGLADKRYLMILKSFGGSTGGNDRLNGDSGSNYASRYDGGGTDYTNVNKTAYPWNNAGYSTTPNFIVEYISNLAGKEKLILRNWMYQYTAGAGNAPRRSEVVAKWTNTTDAISATSMYSQTTDWDSGSEVVVLGWDDSDTHTTNFWEELASVTATGSTTSFNSGTFTAKKYLWVQGYFTSSGAFTPQIRVGNSTIDTGSNYAGRRSYNGGTDVTATSQTEITLDGVGQSTPVFFNGFIINNASNEKLAIFNCVKQNTAGAGNAPHRRETVFKWTNTTNQINIIEFLASTGNIGSTGIMKVWGSN